MLYFVSSCKSVNAINNMYCACSLFLNNLINSYWNYFSNYKWQFTKILFNPVPQSVHFSCSFQKQDILIHGSIAEQSWQNLAGVVHSGYQALKWPAAVNITQR